MTLPPINSRDYWDARFREDWEENQGRLQTAFFARLAVDHLPAWFLDLVKKEKPSICDWGCAEGEGVDLLSSLLDGGEVTGVDFSPEAIARANRNFPDRNFQVADFLSPIIDGCTFDIVFSSNTLEHFAQPLVVLDKVASRARWGVVLLVPFREDERIPEHQVTFDTENVPLLVGEDFVLVHSVVVKTAEMNPTFWGGEQILLIYLKTGILDRRLTLGDMNMATTGYLNLAEEVYLRKNEMEERKFEYHSLLAELHNENSRLWKEKDKAYALCNKITAENTDLAAQVADLTGQIQELSTANSDLVAKIRTLAGQVEESSSVNAVLTGKAEAQERSLQRYDHELRRKEEDLRYAREQIDLLRTSISWRVTAPLRVCKTATNGLLAKVRRARVICRTEGFGHLLIRGRAKYLRLSKPPNPQTQLALAAILNDRSRDLIIFCPLIDWNVPLFQRPQHLALQLSQQGYDYLYCSPGYYDHHTSEMETIGKNLYLTKTFKNIDEILRSLGGRKAIFHCYAQDANFSSNDLDKLLNEEHTILYEYIDALSGDLSVAKEQVMERHLRVLSDERCLVVVTASKLLEEVKSHRRRNYVHVTNGVDLTHFQCRKNSATIPAELERLVARDRVVIGYFGALAKWFDYGLIREIATRRPKWEIVLIGWDYDGSLRSEGLDQLSNVTIFGPIDYKELPRYASWFDVGIIPFVINEITEATSPIKLFEYMALGKPVVTTDLPECRKYRGVLIGRTPDEFIGKLEDALSWRDDQDYMAILRRQALANSWENKVRQITALIECPNCEPEFSSPLLESVQDQIVSCYRADSTTIGYYEQSYRPEERFFWSPVLRWIDQLSSIDSVMDIGTAYGTLLLYTIKRHNPRLRIALDLDSHLTPSYLSRYNVADLRIDIEKNKIPPHLHPVDLIIFTEVIEHLNYHPLPTLKRIRELLKPGGHLILTTPDAEEWGPNIKYYPSVDQIPPYFDQVAEWIDDHIWHYSYGEIEALIVEAGFEIVRFEFSKGIVGRHLCLLLRPGEIETTSGNG
ncbi:MAG: methyltransferase domain-containing protein [Desulfuromonadales bacterium]|nr:methyltransferase domain-containing protein [Desulfuromonadales bacterium]